MNSSHFGIHFLLFIFFKITISQLSCPPPDVPLTGSYSPKQNKYQPGDKVSYNCSEGFTLMGKDTTKCRSNGDWASHTPFCDRKVKVRSLYAIGNPREELSRLIDGNKNTCHSMKLSDAIAITLDKPGAVYALQIYMIRGHPNIQIITGSSTTCAFFRNSVETNQWVLIECSKNDVSSDYLKIQDKSDKGNNSTLCEIEVFIKEDDGCENPPERRVANGYFEVTRTRAKLKCEEGYKPEKNNDRLICEGNNWVGSRLQCNEILCNVTQDFSLPPGSKWDVLDFPEKISAGTRRKLKCADGYSVVGSPDTIVCQKDGSWTKTNASCTATKEATSTKTIIFCVAGILAVVIIICLLGTTIYFIRRQRREVVVVYSQPTDVSVISGSDAGSAYYESIQSIPQPPTTTRPTAQMITEGYFMPLDNHDSKKQPMPADIAFGTLKQSTLYR